MFPSYSVKSGMKFLYKKDFQEVNPKKLIPLKLTPMLFFQNYIFQRQALKPWFFVTFNTIIRHIFSENSIEISQVIWKVWRCSSSILTIFINFLGFFTFLCCKQTKDISMQQMILAFFFFFSLQPTLNWLFINCIKLFWIWISASWNIKRRSNRVKSGVFFFDKTLNRSYLWKYDYYFNLYSWRSTKYMKILWNCISPLTVTYSPFTSTLTYTTPLATVSISQTYIRK